MFTLNKAKQALNEFNKSYPTLGDGGRDLIAEFYQEFISEFSIENGGDLVVVLVAHISSTLPELVCLLAHIAEIAVIIPKGHVPEKEPMIETLFSLYKDVIDGGMNKEILAEEGGAIKYLKTIEAKHRGKRILIADHGAYFREIVKDDSVKACVGIVEHTANGHMAYQRILKEKKCFSLPVFSIALSRLKHHEDPHIVRAIWDSTKAIMEHDLRQDITLFKGPIVIIGYGGLGAAMVDHFLLQKFEGIIRVFDIDPEKREAAKLKYSAKFTRAKIEVAEDITAALTGGILVIGAICSGEMFKKGQESLLANRAFVVGVTSRDDLLGEETLTGRGSTYEEMPPVNTVRRYENKSNGQIIFFRDSINFGVKTGSAHPIIHAVFASVCFGLQLLKVGEIKDTNTMHVLTDEQSDQIYETWHRVFVSSVKQSVSHFHLSVSEDCEDVFAEAEELSRSVSRAEMAVQTDGRSFFSYRSPRQTRKSPEFLRSSSTSFQIPEVIVEEADILESFIKQIGCSLQSVSRLKDMLEKLLNYLSPVLIDIIAAYIKSKEVKQRAIEEYCKALEGYQASLSVRGSGVYLGFEIIKIPVISLSSQCRELLQFLFVFADQKIPFDLIEAYFDTLYKGREMPDNIDAVIQRCKALSLIFGPVVTDSECLPYYSMHSEVRAVVRVLDDKRLLSPEFTSILAKTAKKWLEDSSQEHLDIDNCFKRIDLLICMDAYESALSYIESMCVSVDGYVAQISRMDYQKLLSLLKLARKEEARDFFSKKSFAEHCIDDLGLLFLLTKASLSLGIKEIAAKCLQRALELSPEDNVALYLQGCLLVSENDNQGAEARFERILLSCDYLHVHYHLGVALLNQGKYLESLPCFMTVFRSDSPEYSAVFKRLVRLSEQEVCHEPLRKTLEELRSCPSVIANPHKLGLVLSLIGDLFWKSDEKEGGLACYKKACLAKPTHLHYAVRYLISLIEMEEYISAVSFIEKLAVKFDHPTWYFLCGLTFALYDDEARARSNFAAAFDRQECLSLPIEISWQQFPGWVKQFPLSSFEKEIDNVSPVVSFFIPNSLRLLTVFALSNYVCLETNFFYMPVWKCVLALPVKKRDLSGYYCNRESAIACLKSLVGDLDFDLNDDLGMVDIIQLARQDYNLGYTFSIPSVPCAVKNVNEAGPLLSTGGGPSSFFPMPQAEGQGGLSPEDFRYRSKF